MTPGDMVITLRGMDLPDRLETPADSLPRTDRRRAEREVRVGRFAFTTKVGRVIAGDDIPDRVFELDMAAMCHHSAVTNYGPLVGGSAALPGRCLYRAWRADVPDEAAGMRRFFAAINLPLARCAVIDDEIEKAPPGERVFVVCHWFTEPIDGPAAKAALN